MRIVATALAALLGLSCATSAAAAGGTATDQAVSLSYPPTHWGIGAGAGLAGVDAAGDPLSVAGWWYRAEGDAHEFPLPVPDTETYTDGTVHAVWNNLDNKGFQLEETTYVFDNEGPSGGFLSVMHATNNNASPRQFTLFHYVDLDLAGTTAGDTGEMLAPYTMRFADGTSHALYRFWPSASHFQVAAWPALNALLTDGTVTNLNDTGLPFAPGDVTAAFQEGPLSVQPGSYLQGEAAFFVNLPADRVKGDLHGGLSYPPLLAQRADLTGSPYYVVMRRTQQLFLSTVGNVPGTAVVGVDNFLGSGSNIDRLVSRDLTTGQAYVGGTQISGAPTLPLNWKLAATGDFNADGKADIVWRNTTSQKLVIWTMDDSAKTGAIVPTPDQAVDGNWGVAGAADFDGDGNRDLLWYNQTTGKIVLWYMDAAVVRTTGLFTTPASVGNNNWRVVAVGDFGKGPAQTGTPVVNTQDIVWQNDTSLKMVVWHMDHTAHRTGGGFTAPDSLQPGFVLVGPR